MRIQYVSASLQWRSQVRHSVCECARCPCPVILVEVMSACLPLMLVEVVDEPVCAVLLVVGAGTWERTDGQLDQLSSVLEHKVGEQQELAHSSLTHNLPAE